jgi:hypothetical protein
MSHEHLIAQLARDVTPVTPLPAPQVRVARWVGVALVAVVAVVAMRGLRSNWSLVMSDPGFLGTVALMLVTGLVSALAALALSVPGMVSAWWVRWTPVALVGMWGSVLVFEVWSAGTRLIPTQSGIECVWKTYGIAVAPAVLLVWLARRAAPLDWRWTGCLAALAALSFGVLGTELICPITNHGHLFTWHFLPVAAMTVLVFAVTSIVTRLR